MSVVQLIVLFLIVMSAKADGYGNIQGLAKNRGTAKKKRILYSPLRRSCKALMKKNTAANARKAAAHTERMKPAVLP
jgi:hypothetical protein